MDQTILESLYSLTNFSPFFDGLIIFSGKTLPYIVFLYFLYQLYKSSKKSSVRAIKTSALSVVYIAVLSGIILPILHFFLEKERPFTKLDLEPLFSPIRESTLPSGHAAFFFLLATVALLRISNKSAVILFALASIISFARIISAIHWPSDVILGAALGIAVPLIIELCLKLFSKSKIGAV